MAAADCTTPHAGEDAAEALDRGVQPAPEPYPPHVRTLAEALTHSRSSAEDTQPLDVTTLRAAHDKPKEHPQT
jgi:hypothetical protein